MTSNFFFRRKLLQFPAMLGWLFAVISNTAMTHISAQDNLGTFIYLDSLATGVQFINRCNETPDRCIYQYDYFYNGGGVAIADFNNDGLPDLFFTGNDVPNRLYFNEGNFGFRDVSMSAGISFGKWYTGVTVVDINDDGWNDIYVCCSGPDFLTKPTRNELYINNRNGTFSERASEYGIADNGLSTQAVFFDMDLDGDLDLWVLNHGVRNIADEDVEWLQRVKMIPRDQYLRFCNTVYRNDHGHYVNVSVEAGITEVGFGLGIAVSDFNRDGLPDVYICNDYFIPDRYYINKGNGKFSDEIRDKIPHCSYFSMGCDAADINNDGWPDLAVLDMTPADHYRNKMLMNGMNVNQFRFLTENLEYEPQYMFNTLLMNYGLGMMSDVGQLASVHQSDWSWAPLLADLDNDGLRDLYIANGYKRDVKNNDWRLELLQLMDEPGFNSSVYFDHLQKADVTPIPNPVYHNKGELRFEPGNQEWQLNRPSFSNGAAYGDLDLDGDLDLVVNNLDQVAFICRNDITVKSANHFIRISLMENDSAICLSNATVSVHAGNLFQRSEYQFSRGYQSYMEPVIHFGLGSETKVDSLLVNWGNGQVTRLINIEADLTYLINHSDSEFFNQKIEDEISFFSSGIEFRNETQNAIQPPFFHEENVFDDFEKEVLLPHKQSMLGPGMAVADANGDGQDDFFIGNAKGSAPALYIQNDKGIFTEKKNALPLDQLHSEILGAIFFNANGDTYPDLYIATGGGGEFSIKDSTLADEILFNDGTGNFKPIEGALPISLQSTKVVKACDYDMDGDEDLFVGGRNVPGAYPLSPRSLLLNNEGGKFSIDLNWSSENSQCGMVTDAIWFDWNGDQTLDLVLVGEWTAVQVFINRNGKFTAFHSAQIDELTGWWSSIGTWDMDEDGDQDLLLGNLGWNNKFHPSPEKPLELYANDFDNNGTLDIVLGKHYKNHVVPVRGRECSSVQMPFITERFPSFNSFASSTLEQIYSQEQLNSALHLQVKTFSSYFLLNNGNGNYDLQEMPSVCQVAPINSFVVQDMDNDGHQDLVLGGNNIQTEVETIPYDAGKGVFLKGGPNGQYTTYSSIEDTGLYIPGDVKLMLPVSILRGKYNGLLVAKNNSRLNLILVKKR